MQKLNVFVCSAESRTSWILPFTAGGFLHIGMVTVLPELLKESDPKESLKQLGALLIGIIVMGLLTILCDWEAKVLRKTRDILIEYLKKKKKT